MSLPTVIIADDDAGMRYLCRVNLELEGYRVLEAESASEVRQRLEETDEAAVLVLDARLGRDDGVALGHELLRTRPDLPIIVITGDSRAEVAKELTDVVLTKPFGLDDFLGAVRRSDSGNP